MKKKDPTSHRIIEKRRRDRMNNCLADLSKLIPAHYMKKGRGRIEKTEIIEMAIKHLKDLIRQTSASSSPSSSDSSTSATAIATTTAASPRSASLPELAASAATEPTTDRQHNGAKPNAALDAQAAHCATRDQLATAGPDERSAQSNPLAPTSSADPRAASSSSSSSCSLSSLSAGDSQKLTSSHSDNSTSTRMMVCSENLEQPSRAAFSNSSKRHHHQVNGFISDQDFQHLANVNKTLTTVKMEPSSPPSAALTLPPPLPLVAKSSSSSANTAPLSTCTKSSHNHYHSGHHHHPQPQPQPQPQTSAGSACPHGSCPFNSPKIDSTGSGSEGLATDSSSASKGLTSASHQHHYQLYKYRSSPNSSGSDSGGSSSSYRSSGDNGTGSSSGNMSGSSSGHLAGGSSCSMRTSCSSSSVTSMKPGNPNRTIGLVVDRGTTTSLQAAMAGASVTVNELVGGDTSMNSGASSSSLNSVSSDVMMASSPVRSLAANGAVPANVVLEAGEGIIECCTCGSRILQTLKQQRVNGDGSSSDSSIGSNGPPEKPTALANKSQSASNQVDPDSLDFSAKTIIVAGKQTTTSNRRRPSNGDNKCNSLGLGSLRPGSSRHHLNSSSGLLSSAHSAANSSTSSSSNSTLSLASSNSSAAWYKKAWLVRSFSRSPTPR